MMYTPASTEPMISDTIQKTSAVLAQMSYETWVSILLAALAVLLALVTLIVALAGIGIAIVGIWGFRGLRKLAQQRVDEAVEQMMAKYPDAGKFIEVHQAMQELYQLMQRQMSAFKQEIEVLHQRSEDANTILERLNPRRGPGASNGIEAIDEVADKRDEPIVAIYPGEEAGSDDGNVGKSIKDEGAASTDPR
jgi:Zn-dependent protease with chaperone function